MRSKAYIEHGFKCGDVLTDTRLRQMQFFSRASHIQVAIHTLQKRAGDLN